MNVLKKVRDTINSLTQDISDKEFFSGREFREFIMASLKTALGELARRTVSLEIFYNEHSDMTACTNGEVILANAGTRIVQEGETLRDRYLMFLGMLIHETGHRLFTDFPASAAFHSSWERLCPSAVDDPRWESMLEELRTFPNLKKLFLSVCRNADNIFEDGYIEQKIFGYFDGVFAYGLHSFNRMMFSKYDTVGERFDSILAEEDKDKRDMRFVSFLMAQTIRVVKEYPERTGNIDTPEKEMLYRKYSAFMAETERICHELMYEADWNKRSILINEYMLNLYDYFPGKSEEEEYSKEESENKEESDDKTESTGSSSSSSTPGRSSDIPEELAEGSNLPSGSVAPKGTTRPVDIPGESEKEAEEKKARTKELSESRASEREFESAFEEVIREMAETKVEKEHSAELQEEAEEIFKKISRPLPAPYSPWEYEIRRKGAYGITDTEKEIYLNISKEMHKYSEPAIRKLNVVLVKRAEEGSTKGYQIGRFDPIQYPRAAMAGDGRTFRQNRLPNGMPSVVFSILIDESGSMEGMKVQEARKTAILLSDILNGVGVPHMIVGHTTSHYGETCTMNLYHDFDEVDGKDKYRLAGIKDDCGNRDGAAIAYMSEKLLKRPEADKVLIVISDGWPTEAGFFSPDAREDTKETLRRYRKKGVNIIGAVIDCYHDIEKIYGRMNCLDLTDLSKLPVTLSSLVKRYILR